MTAWDLVLAHRYRDALTVFDSRRRAGVSQDSLEIANRCTALLCLGEYNEALEGFTRANQLAAERLQGEAQPYLDKMGTILWLLGRRAEATETFRHAVDGILDGAIKFADNSGGVSLCLLLWYAAVTSGDHAQKEHAEKCIRKLAKRSRIREWPGALGLLVVGIRSPESLIVELCGVSSFGECLAQSKRDLLLRRRLVKALFYIATCSRAKGSESECAIGMAQCAGMENPIVEAEWYLAHSEITQAVPHKR
jgi:tetratricopeptide (TPR) repeat protein